MSTNKNDVKYGILKGVILFAISCIFFVINPIMLDKGETSVSAATTTDIETARKDALEELKNVYKTYNKKYYKAKAYKKLTKYYNKGVSNINKANSITKVEKYLEKYCDLMNGISPSILVKYQKKMETKLLTSYKNLITKNTYSDNNLVTIEDIKNEGINKIYETKTKTQAKKVKNTYINNLKTVKNVLDEIKEAAYNYINSIKDLNQTEKNKLIDQVSKMTKENDVLVLMEKNGYDPKGVIEDYVETDPNKMTKEILNDEKNWMNF